MSQEVMSHSVVMDNSSMALNAHLVGMWLNFALSALLITYFVVPMARSIRQQAETINELREADLRQEQVLAVATLAAGTAHHLGTPLSTIKTLVSNALIRLAEDQSGKADEQTRPASNVSGKLSKDLQTIQQQVYACQSTLKHLVQQAEQPSLNSPPTVALYDFCDELIEQWLVIRPDVEADVRLPTHSLNPQVDWHNTLRLALMNLFNNSADASPTEVEIMFDWGEHEFRVDILDRGPGVDDRVKANLGKVPVSTKDSGLGIGMMISQSTISRHSGKVMLFERSGGGTHTQVILPIRNP
ncbi:hypothetical protein GCM10007877_00570 [Marinibactrum halimedae]|uniref:histidine kinase n=2 Tax=Marinibactrum halimedae TaxID=1444977 RepID=A0AA37T315_9GAMM|nr:hypothetical protein GCM10007877_00570 [Marinibactrum halimedae]